MSIHRFQISQKAQKDIRKLPTHIVEKLQAWVSAVKQHSLEELWKSARLS